jgi:hypothetical protein
MCRLLKHVAQYMLLNCFILHIWLVLFFSSEFTEHALFKNSVYIRLMNRTIYKYYQNFYLDMQRSVNLFGCVRFLNKLLST